MDAACTPWRAVLYEKHARVLGARTRLGRLRMKRNAEAFEDAMLDPDETVVSVEDLVEEESSGTEAVLKTSRDLTSGDGVREYVAQQGVGDLGCAVNNFRDSHLAQMEQGYEALADERAKVEELPYPSTSASSLQAGIRGHMVREINVQGSLDLEPVYEPLADQMAQRLEASAGIQREACTVLYGGLAGYSVRQKVDTCTAMVDAAGEEAAPASRLKATGSGDQACSEVPERLEQVYEPVSPLADQIAKSEQSHEERRFRIELKALLSRTASTADAMRQQEERLRPPAKASFEDHRAWLDQAAGHAEALRLDRQQMQVLARQHFGLKAPAVLPGPAASAQV